MKMDIAIALARKFTGTVSRISVFTGPVPRNNRNIAPARQIIELLSTTRNPGLGKQGLEAARFLRVTAAVGAMMEFPDHGGRSLFFRA